MRAMTTRRKLAIATWDSPREGNIYGRLVLDTAEVRRYLAWVREESGEKVTLTHFVGACVAEALKATPSLNGRIWLGRYLPHETVDISFLVALEEGGDLGKARIHRADELGPAGIRVNAVSPGLVVTPLTAPAMDIPGVKDDYVANTPLGRPGTPEEVAAAVSWLCSEESAWMTGEVMDLNGGAHTQRYPDLLGHVNRMLGAS